MPQQLLFQMLEQIEESDIEKIRILGEGTYGKCYLVHNKKTNELCVLKQIQIFGMSDPELEQVKRQAKILAVLKHPYIVKCLHCYKTQSYLNILMEYADGGDLNHALKQAKGTLFPQNQILNWFTQICLAIKHIHDRKVIHRDLKCSNIFLTKEGLVKLGDFGIARHLSRTLDKIKTVVGTPYYMSPQICSNQDYSFKTDIWSLGVILYEMCTHKLPFEGNSLPVLALKISRGQYSPLTGYQYSKQLKKLISSLLQSNPTRRPNIAKILQNPLLQKRISIYLPQQIQKSQFSHTTLHSHNLFEKENDSQNNQDVNEYMMGRCKIKSKDDQIKGEKIDLNKVISSSNQAIENEKKQEVHSARSNIGKNNGKPVQYPKNLDFGQKFNSGNLSNINPYISGKEKQKKKKVDAFKRRQISQPNLALKGRIGRSQLLSPIQETQRKQDTQNQIENTLIEVVKDKFGGDSKWLLQELDDKDGFNEQIAEGNGILTLLWGYKKYKNKL